MVTLTSCNCHIHSSALICSLLPTSFGFHVLMLTFCLLKDEKLQNVLGHFQKDFEGGVSAENLGKSPLMKLLISRREE